LSLLLCRQYRHSQCESNQHHHPSAVANAFDSAVADADVLMLMLTYGSD
jgi:hypothetical protein